MTLRLNKEGGLTIGVPYHVSLSSIDSFVMRSLPTLLKKVNRYDKDIDEDSYFLFGQRLPRLGLTEKQIKSYLKKELTSYCISQTLYYEALMEISPAYSVLIRDMSSRYGVNSKTTHRITYALSLAHYSREIIDAIIVHELAHHFQRNHQKGFYDIVYRYCPHYDELHKKLRKHIHA